MPSKTINIFAIVAAKVQEAIIGKQTSHGHFVGPGIDYFRIRASRNLTFEDAAGVWSNISELVNRHLWRLQDVQR